MRKIISLTFKASPTGNPPSSPRKKSKAKHKSTKYSPDFSRVIRANARAENRKKDGLDLFETIFDFNTPKGKIRKKDPQFVVKLKDKHKDMSAKKVLEVLQQHRNSKKYKNKILDVQLNFGGNKKGFRMDPAGKAQIFIKTLTQGYYYGTGDYGTYKDGYDEVSKIFRKGDEKKYALAILKALNKPISKQKKILSSFKPEVIQAMMSLIAFTQVAEACPSANGVRGRTPGMNKLARASIKRIARGKSTFTKEFKKNGGRYFPAEKGGTQTARDAIKNEKPPSKKRDSSGYMSDSSDEGF